MATKAIQKTRAQWAKEIRAAHQQSVEAVIKIGRLLIAAKRSLPHGAFQKMIEQDLPFGLRTAQILMAIAKDQRLANAKHVSLLPPHWSTLYALHELTDAQFNKAIKARRIHPDMERDEVRSLRLPSESVRLEFTRSEPVTIRPVYVYSPREPTSVLRPRYSQHEAAFDDEDDAVLRIVPSQAETTNPSPDVASLSLTQIERLVAHMEKSVERGDVQVDANFAARIQAVAEQLLALISDRSPPIDPEAGLLVSGEASAGQATASVSVELSKGYSD